MSSPLDRLLGFPREMTQEDIDAAAEERARCFSEFTSPSSGDDLPRTLEEVEAMDLQEFLENFSEEDAERARSDEVALMSVTFRVVAHDDDTGSLFDHEHTFYAVLSEEELNRDYGELYFRYGDLDELYRISFDE